MTGLDESELVTIHLRERQWDTLYESAARFEANVDGVVDVTKHAPVEGDYDGVRPMGLFQFATEVTDRDRRNSGLENVGETAGDTLSFVGRIRASVGEDIVDAATYERVVRPAGVTKLAVDHSDIVGDIYLPAEEGPHPGIVYFGGSEGGRPGTVEASLLAAHGYAVLGLAYFGTEDLPDHLVDIPVEYFETAIEWFGDLVTVNAEPVGVMGGSRGSEMALWLGANVPEVRTVVVTAPSDVLFEGIWLGRPDEWDRPGAAWTRNGEALPFVSIPMSLTDVIRWGWQAIRGRPVEIADTYAEGKVQADLEAIDAAAIPVEKTDGPILLLSGEDDRVWQSNEMADTVRERLAVADYGYRFEHHSFPDAGHSVAAPYRPVTDRETADFGPRVELALGGTPEGHADADADSWPLVLDVFEEGLR